MLGQAAAAAHRRQHGAATARSPIGELTAFVLYLNAFFAPIQQLVQLYNLYQQGQAAIAKLRRAARHATRRVEESADADAAAADRGRRSRSSDVSFGYDPAVPVLRDVDLAHRRRARRSSLVGPDRRGQVDHRQARHPLLRPDRAAGAASTATTSATSRSSRCAASSASCPQEPFLFAGTLRDNIAFARPDATDDEVMRGRATASASTT